MAAQLAGAPQRPGAGGLASGPDEGADSLVVRVLWQDELAVRQVVQIAVWWGISPCLAAGVGIPLEERLQSPGTMRAWITDDDRMVREWTTECSSLPTSSSGRHATGDSG